MRPGCRPQNMQGSGRIRPFAMLTLLLLSSLSPIISSAEVAGRAQTTWSGTVVLTSDYYIPVTDELVISSCTNVTMDSGVRIVVEGRITVEGTSNCPVYLDYLGNGDHMGIVFNSTSNGRGSQIDNLTIVHSVYGITVYGSDPVISNLTVFNPDDVGVDLFSGATPTIRNLIVNEAGQDWVFPQYWRYGIGLSVGSGSAPNVDGVILDGLVTRGINYWHNSGGVIRNITITNVSGATLATAAGIWVEDSVPLIEHVSIDRADHGVLVQHTNDTLRTRAVIRDVSISNSMYKGLYIDKTDHTNYTNYQAAIIEGLTVTGTGGAGAKTAGLATAAIEVNASGAWIEDAILEDNDAVGIKLYFVDSTSTFTNVSINSSGGLGSGANGAGVSIFASYFAASFDGLEISNSTGPGVHASSGGAIQGSDWNLHDNGAQGFWLDSAATIVDGLVLTENGDDGVHINDARYVYLSNLSSSGNSDAGMSFYKANDIETTSGDVSCLHCTTTGDGRGIVVSDSVDLWLTDVEIHDPIVGPAISVDNSGLDLGVQGGSFHFIQTEIWTNHSTEYAINITSAEGEIDGLDIHGSHQGIYWDANHNVERTSILSNARLSGTDCLKLLNHDQMTGMGSTITTACTGDIEFTDSEVNWSNLEDQTNHVLNLDADTHLHLHQPISIDFSAAIMASGAWIDVAWDIDVWVVNNYSNGVPNAVIDVSFDQLEPAFTESTNDFGLKIIPDLVGKRYTYNGETPFSNVTVDCSYDGVSNSTSSTLDQDISVWCHLPLDNQAPFLIWEVPVDEDVFPSHAMIQFNASQSWDLDDDPMTFNWTSSIVGIFGSSDNFYVNDGGPSEIILPDGIHDITLEICDDKGNCVDETRTIELANQPPEIIVNTDPALTAWGELHSPLTKPVAWWLNGTNDPENDSMSCSWTWPGHSETISDCIDGSGNLSFADMSITMFDLTLSVSDGINTPSTLVVSVELFNEMPNASFTIDRADNFSENEVVLTSTSIDPESDPIEYLWSSNLDGNLGNQSVWTGHLSRGSHVISLSVTDGRMEHVNLTSINTQIIIVENSPPRAVIGGPDANGIYDSSHLFEFNSSGSGDWDSACATFPTGIDWHCAPVEPAPGSEWLVYSWVSDVDGILQEDGQDWLIFETHLSSGQHNITLSMDDGINNPVVSTIQLNVTPSAPVLGLVSPDLSVGYHSSETITLDISDSVDYDGDEFTFSLSSDLMTETILEDEDPMAIHLLNLPAGDHTLTFTLTDETGESRDEEIFIEVVESDPIAIIFTPNDGQYFAPGSEILLDSEGTYDADDDITKREWRHYIPGAPYPTIVSNDAVHTLSLSPGAHHLSLYVEDRRGGWDENHINITAGSSPPDLSNLTVSSDSLIVNKLTTLVVEVELDDPDGTTNLVTGIISHDMQKWEFNLSDEDGDGIWIGSVDVMPGIEGRAALKVTAHDGGVIDSQSMDLKFRNQVEDTSSIVAIGGGIGIFILLSLAIAMFVIRRRKKFADLELIDNWGVFGSETKEYLQEDIDELK